jgi:hypothetical protein
MPDSACIDRARSAIAIHSYLGASFSQHEYIKGVANSGQLALPTLNDCVCISSSRTTTPS